MSMLDEARRLAEEILDRLSPTGTAGWTAGDAHEVDRSSVPPPPGLTAEAVVLVSATGTGRFRGHLLRAHFVPALPLAEAVVALADQLQDQAIEAASGEP